MSMEEDELELLRSAALASRGKKKRVVSDVEDLDALRREALTSCKNQQTGLFERLQPVKSSNLINLTPDPNKEPQSALSKPKHKFNRRSSLESNHSVDASASSGDDKDDYSNASRETSSSEAASSNGVGDSSSSEEESSRDEEVSKAQDVKTYKSSARATNSEEVFVEKNEEDDLLNAIDQFLDEGVIMLDEALPSIEPSKSTEEQTKQKDTCLKEKKLKVKKKRKTKEKSNKKETDKQSRLLKNNKKKDKTKNVHLVEKKRTSAVKKIEEDSNIQASEKRKSNVESLSNIEHHPNRFQKNVRSFEKSCDTNKQSHQESKVSYKKHSGDSDSVHSSDLSFLTDSSNDETEKSEPKKSKLRPNVSRRKLNTRLRTNGNKQRDEQIRLSEETDVTKNRTIRKKTAEDQAFPDLREKLKRKGLPRIEKVPPSNNFELKVQDVKRVEKKSTTTASTLATSAQKRNKIYVKPAMLLDRDEASIKVGTAMSSNKLKEEENFVVMRKFSNQSFSPITVRVENVKEKNIKVDSNSQRAKNSDQKKPSSNTFSFRRRRSVVQFAPDTSAVEKLQKLESLKAQAREKERSFSDMSDQEFDDYEIEEPGQQEDDNAEVYEVKKISPNAATTDTRRFVTTSRPVSATSKVVPKSTVKETTSPEPVKRLRLSKAVITKSAIEAEPRDVREKLSRNRLYKERREEQDRSRISKEPESTPKNSFVAKRQRLYKDETLFRQDRASEEEDPDVWYPRSARARRHKREYFQEESAHDTPPSSVGSLKRRIGFRNNSPPDVRRSKTGLKRSDKEAIVEEQDEGRRKKYREQLVDERIRRINKQNEEILKRRQMIEMEERKFRLKAIPT